MQFSDVFEPNVSVLVSMEGGGGGLGVVLGNEHISWSETGWRLLIHIND